jgi:nicotinamidase/pyrazinamidase
MTGLTISATTDALLVIDVQPDFMPGGALPVADGDAVVRPIAALLGRFRTVVATQDWHPAGHRSFASSHPGRAPYDTVTLHGEAQTLWPDHCVQGTPGAALHHDLPHHALSLILRKGTDHQVDSYSAFRENVGPDRRRAPTGLTGWLRERGISRVFACGLARDFCVRWSAEDAADAGFSVVFLDDLTRSVFPDPARVGEVTAALTARGVRLARSTELV